MATVSAPALFQFDQVQVVVGDRSVLEGVDAVIPDGGISVLVGPSGSGKSTMLRLCNRLVVPTAGRVLFRGEDLADSDPLSHRRRVGMVFQQPVPFGGTVRDNLRVAAPGATRERMLRALDRAHLPAVMLERPAGELSGGECQRACLARTLVTEPEVLLMDEPTSALDEQARLALEGLARKLAGDGVPVVWVTHDLDQVGRLADHVIVMAEGRVIASGAASDRALEAHLPAPAEARAGG